MNFLFTHTHTYFSYEPIENVREKIKALTRKPWYDATPNLAGRFTNEKKFTLTSKWSFVLIKWLERDTVYLNGTLSEHGSGTQIDVSVRPNSGLVIFFYLLIILFIFEAFGTTILEGSVWFKLGFYALFCLILLFLMRFSIENIKMKLEKYLGLSPKV